MGLITNFLMT